MTVTTEPAETTSSSARTGPVATLRVAAGDAFTVVGRAFRLLARHWPVLLAILFVGEAGRYAALWAAVEISDVNGPLGVLVLALAPLAAVSALIAALYAMRNSLPSLGFGGDESDADAAGGVQGEPVPSGRAGLLGVLGSVLVPFLAIYASYGFLAEDTFRFVNAAVTDELFDVDVFLGTEEFDAQRTMLATGWAALVVVAVAVVLRWGLGVLAARRYVPGLAWIAAYIEVLWLVTLARTLASHQDAALTWLGDRPVVRGAVDLWDRAMEVIGPIGAAINAAMGWLFDLLGSADSLLVLPVAWLTVGAVVYGHQLPEPQKKEKKRSRAKARPRSRVVQQVSRPARTVGDQLSGGLVERFGALADGIRRLAIAGLAPMLLFVLAFVIAQRLEHLVNLGWRALLGPMPLDTYLAFVPQMQMVSHVIGTVVVVCLLGAAIDRVLERGREQADAESITTASR